MRYAVTGPRDLTDQQAAGVWYEIDQLHDVVGEVDEFTSGAAFGVDTVAIEHAELLAFGTLRLAVPQAPYNYQLVREAEAKRAQGDERWVVAYAPHGRDYSQSYMLRNDLIIAHTDVLLAFPPTPREIRRGPGGGTWATIRRARKAGREVRFYPLDGSEAWTEPATRVAHG